MKRVLKILDKLLLYGLFALGIILLFYGTGRISTMIFAFESFLAAILVAWFFKLKGINEKYLVFVYAGLWLNMIGELIAYYNGTFLYDKFLHFVLGMLLSAITLEHYEKNSNLKKDSTFLTVLGMLALWEIYEFTLDTFFGFQLQGVSVNNVMVQPPFIDTMYDLIWGSIGALVYLFLKKERGDRIIRENIQKNKVKFSTFLKKLLKW